MLPPEAQDRGHGGTTDFTWFVMGPATVKGYALASRLTDFPTQAS